jgi:hypothetical protein
MRKIIAVTITKLFIIIGKLVGKKGSSTPGKFALFIYPGILKYLASQIRGKIIVVCGTNGKTTTNNMLCSLLESEGKKVVCNHVGANMLEGVVTAFAGSTNFLGRLDADYACIEIDEISAASVFEHFLPDYMIITNLFRDQLDRYGEIDITIRHLSKAVSKAENAVLVLNADDPLVAALGKNAKNKCVYYGIGEDAGISLSETKEGRFCSFCHSELVYSFYHYSQLGSYGCVKCGFSRPKPQYEALDVNLTDEMSFTVDGKRISVNYRGFYNIYNILAAYAAVRLCGFSLDNINDVLGAYKPQIGMELRFTENENDYLVFGIDEEFVIKTSDHIEGTLENFCEHMKNEHNLIIQAHPFRGNCKAANPEYLDGVETFNMHPGQNSKNSFALKFAKENNLIQIAGTDFHHPGMECLTALLTKKPIENSFELSEVLKSTDYLFEIGGDIVIPYIK